MIRSFYSVFLLIVISTMILSAQEWIPIGSTIQIVEECDTCFQLTEEEDSQAGCVWNQESYDFSSNLEIAFTLNFGDNNNNGADGISMILADIPNQCGGFGEELGAGGLINTVIYEFDNFTNPGPYDDPGLCQDHIGMCLDGDLANSVLGPECFGSFPFYQNIEDGDYHDVRFIWNAGLSFFEIEFDGDIVFDGNFDIVGHLGTSDVFVGFGAGTGGLSNVQIVCPGIGVQAPPEPVFIEVINEICTGASDTFIIDSGGGNISWSFPDGGSIVIFGDTAEITFGDVSGEICIFAFDNCGTSDTLCHFVQVVAFPDVTVITPPVICDSAFTLTDIEIAGLTTESVSYYVAESDAENNQDEIQSPFEIDQDAIVWIRVENSTGCFSIYSVDIDFGNIEPGVDPNTPSVICEGKTFDLSSLTYSDVNGNSIVDLSWYETESDAIGGMNEISEIVDTDGGYWARLTSDQGCIGVLEIFVEVLPVPMVEVLNDELDCSDTAYQLITIADPFLFWEWSGPNSFTSSEENPLITEAGIYFVTVTDVNGCTTEASGEITGTTDLPDIIVSGEDLTCENDSLFFLVEPIDLNYQYNWSGPNGYESSDAEPLYTEAGIYDLVITTPENCELVFSIEVEANNQNFENVVIDVQNTDCDQAFGSIQVIEFIGGNGLVLYSIDGGITFQESPLFSNLGPGSYELYFEDAAGCNYQESIDIAEQQIGQIDLINEVEISSGDSILVKVFTDILFENIENIQWSPSEFVSCDTCLATHLSPTVTTLFQFILEDVNGCLYHEEILVSISGGSDLYIPNVFSPNDDALNDRFYVLSDSESSVIIEEMSIYNRWGQLVFSAQNIPVNDPSYGWDGYFRGELLNPDVFTFMVKVQIDGEAQYLTGDITLLQ